MLRERKSAGLVGFAVDNRYYLKKIVKGVVMQNLLSRRKNNLESKTVDKLSFVANISSIAALALVIIGIFLPSLQKTFFILLLFVLIVMIVSTLLKGELPFDDQYAVYTLTLLNLDGDTLIQRDMTFKNSSKQIVFQREHVVFSDSSTVESFDELGIKAWDKWGHDLTFNVTKDKPNEKRFLVGFSRPIRQNELYSYSYCYAWPQFLAKNEEMFVAMDICSCIEVIVRLPKDIKLQRLICSERFPDGERRACNEIDRTEYPAQGEYSICLLKGDRFNKVEVVITFTKS